MGQFDVTGFSLDASGNVSAVGGAFSGAVSGTTGTFSGAVAGTTGTFSGAVAGTTGTFSGAVAGTTGTFTGLVTTAGQRRKRRTSAADVTLAITDDILAITSTGAARAVTLPAASTAPAGQQFTVKDEGGDATANVITITRAGSDVIDGANTYVLDANYEAVTFYSDGVSKWFTC